MERIEWLIKHGPNWLGQDTEQAHAPNLSVLDSWQRELIRDQFAMRRRAAGRFPQPAQWLWTQRSLAQASDWWCANFKASLFAPDELVMDGCSGAGVDLVALAQRGPTLGLELDAELVQIANANLASHMLPPSAIVGRIPDDVPAEAAWLHLDPDRRAADSLQTRIKDAEQFSPSLSESLELAGRMRGAMIKIAPGTKLDPGSDLTSGFDGVRWWLGNLGECRQQLLINGELLQRLGVVSLDERAAVLCEPLGTHQFHGKPSSIMAGRDNPLKYVYDCHAVLHAAQLQTAWGEATGTQPIGTSQGYFTSDEVIRSPWAQGFEVIEVLPWDYRRVKRWLRERHVGEVEVKKRLLQLDANEQQRVLRGSGDEKVTLLITRLANRVRAIAARRIVPPEHPLEQSSIIMQQSP